ncbi:MAG: pilus assembly protein TadG-related protein [Acidobacteriota bacterium]
MHMLVLLGTIMVIFMGFAFDLGRLYLNRSELQTMASAMAIAAAQQLIGTEISTAYAGSAARAAVSVANGGGNRYDFGGIVLGEGTTLLSSEVPEPRFYESMSGATGEGDGGLGQEVSGGAARFARVEVRADAPLVFFGLLFIAADRKVPLATAAVAGVSAPVCSACGTEPIAVAAPNTEDSTDFGFVRGTRYTFHYQCNGQPLPQPLGTAASRLPYLLLNRLDAESSNFATEDSQLFRNGNNGVPPSNNLNQACITIGQPVQIWATATPRLCSQTAPNPTVQQFLCGLNNRFDNSLSDPACAAITDSATLSSAPPVDNDLNDFDDFTSYTGRGRRIITIAVVDLLSSTADMAVLGFRQFLVMPNPGVTTLSPADGPGRFAAIYIGYPAPLRQGRFGSCGVSSGPGKVVLHR